MTRARATLVVTLAVLAAACGADPGPTAGATVERSAASEVDAAEPPAFPWEREAAGEDVPRSVPVEEIVSGGPPPDGIPPIDEPRFETVEAAGEWLEADEPVMVVTLDEAVRLYPLAILTYHEIVNDTLAGSPLVVTYCPLCNSGLVFERTVEGEVLDFGTSGRLWRSNLVMYDRSSRSLWTQYTGEAIVGDRLGQRLERLASQLVAFSDAAAAWPDADVLSRETGEDRPYGQNPYPGYDTGEDPFLFDGDTAGPLEKIARVAATGGDEDPVAYPLEALRELRVVHDDVAGEPVVVLWAPGTASALDTADLSEGRDVGATGIFTPVADERQLTFEPSGEARFTDAETGSEWTVLGRAVTGPLEGTQLERVPHDDTFWFVQHAFRPTTRITPDPAP